MDLKEFDPNKHQLYLLGKGKEANLTYHKRSLFQLLLSRMLNREGVEGLRQLSEDRLLMADEKEALRRQYFYLEKKKCRLLAKRQRAMLSWEAIAKWRLRHLNPRISSLDGQTRVLKELLGAELSDFHRKRFVLAMDYLAEKIELSPQGAVQLRVFLKEAHSEVYRGAPYDLRAMSKSSNLIEWMEYALFHLREVREELLGELVDRIVTSDSIGFQSKEMEEELLRFLEKKRRELGQEFLALLDLCCKVRGKEGDWLDQLEDMVKMLCQIITFCYPERFESLRVQHASLNPKMHMQLPSRLRPACKCILEHYFHA